MDFIKKYFFLIIFLLLLVTSFLLGRDIIIPHNLEDSNGSIRNMAYKRSVLVQWESSSWSGIIFSAGLFETNILTIIHEDSMRVISKSENKLFKITFEDKKVEYATIYKWDGCNELSILKIKSNNLEIITTPNLALDSYISEKLFSFGHPLGLSAHYAEGYLSSKNLELKPCGMITYGFSGGTIPGQTGSGIWNFNGELSGLIIATSAYKVKNYNEFGDVIGASAIPVTFLGRYIPSKQIITFMPN